ncbi:trypsin-like serine peptidase [Streptantibioticus cattleyicolor]|uniref:trypsin-like serine peptidase n=1 Tax=Streptantibioticus cattleyicolor TaxID=29303 RepID=UPI001E586086
MIDTSSRNIVLTAGHCGMQIDASYVFVPQFVKGAGPDQQPFGIFKIQRIFMDVRYGPSQTALPVSDLDTAFARVAPNQFGKRLQDAVGGGLTFTRPSSYNNAVQIIGYPAYKYNKAGHAVEYSQLMQTTQLPGYRQMQMNCTGFFGGTSGSPWITDWNPKTLTGHVIGNLGGKGGGGSNDWTSYAPLFGQNAADLLNDAITNQDPPRNPSPYVGLQLPANAFPEGASTWQHAKLLASGDYTGNHHSDLIVVWTDGEVTLYPGDGKGGFLPEHQLAKPKSIWANAVTITGGDFAGGGLYDLMVVWVDGEVTLYPDVSANGFGSEVQMVKPHTIWEHAQQIAAGQFHNGTYVTDLVVRWDDGELTLYTSVGSGTFGNEYQLQKPDPTWKNATLVTCGTFSGQQNWDIFIRWVDGELDTYVATSSQTGLGTETKIASPNRLWGDHASVITAGNYIGDNINDDLIVRWSDGETTLYEDNAPFAIGTEHTLVYPGT